MPGNSQLSPLTITSTHKQVIGLKPVSKSEIQQVPPRRTFDLKIYNLLLALSILASNSL